MSKAIVGVAQLAGAAALGALAFVAPSVLAIPGYAQALSALVLSGISSEVSAVAQALQGNRGINITDRRPASNRQIIYGTQMVGGVLVYESVTGHQYNQVIVLAGHEIHSIQAIYLDGRKVYFKGSGAGWSVRNGVGFGGDADNADHLGPDGRTNYNFGGKIYVEARYGDQPFGDYMNSLQAQDAQNNPWGPQANGDVPSLTGCAYIYLKCVASDAQFPARPEVRILVNGKCDILDPRIGGVTFTNNAALVLADVIMDQQFGLGDASVNIDQLIAAANICDEQVPVAALNGGTERRWCCDWSYDTGTAPADVMQTMLTGMAGRLSQVGGEYFIFPGAYTGPSLTFTDDDFTAEPKWNPRRSVRDLPNRVQGTHVSPEYPYSVSGTYYQQPNVGTQNNFDLKFTQSSYPYYAYDHLHGYPVDQFLNEDNGHIRPLELGLPTVLSLTQCQRVAKINLARARVKQGTGSFELRLRGYQLMPCDTFTMTSNALGLTGTVLEVIGTSLRIDKVSTDDGDINVIRYAMEVQETDPSIYAWSTIEELTVFASPAAPSQIPDVPAPPTDVQATSSAATAFVTGDGVLVPGIRITWDTPLDLAAVGIQTQFIQWFTDDWQQGPVADISLNATIIAPVASKTTYNIRVRTVRANGTASEWVEVDNITVPSFDGQLGVLATQVKYSDGQIVQALQPAGAGADKTSDQPLAYAGINGNLIQNGDFLLRTTQGWLLSAVSFDPTVPCIGVSAMACSPTFAVQPGNKYRFIYDAASTTGNSPGFLHRINMGSKYAPNVTDQGAGPTDGYLGYVDLAVETVGARHSYVYDWTCPAGVYYATLSVFNIGGSPTVVYYRFSAQDYTAAKDWGADDSSNNPIIYAGTTGNLIGNGDFLKGNSVGWALNGVSFYNSDRTIWLPSSGVAITAAFGVQPGNKYRITYEMGKIADGDSSYQRIFWGNQYQPNISDSSPGYMGYQDFIFNAGLVWPLTDYTYDWVCPAGAKWASLAVYNIGGGSTYISRAIAQDYAAANEWGADKTGNNTSNNTNNVANVPAYIIANVVPTGYRLILNTGNRSLSIQAL